MEPKYIQVDCRETEKIDLRQAKAILKYKPDIVILEYPNNSKTPSIALNKYKPKEKPKKLIEEHTKGFSKEILKIHPWAKADTAMWKNISALWQKGHQILVYKADGPGELTGEWLEVWKNTYPCVLDNWLWWVKIYLREAIMAKNMRWVFENYKIKTNPTVCVFLHNFHWKHVKFLLSNPSKDGIWDYYFGKFGEINQTNIKNKIKKHNKIFFKYWEKVEKIQSSQ